MRTRSERIMGRSRSKVEFYTRVEYVRTSVGIKNTPKEVRLFLFIFFFFLSNDIMTFDAVERWYTRTIPFIIYTHRVMCVDEADKIARRRTSDVVLNGNRSERSKCALDRHGFDVLIFFFFVNFLRFRRNISPRDADQNRS